MQLHSPIKCSAARPQTEAEQRLKYKIYESITPFFFFSAQMLLTVFPVSFIKGHIMKPLYSCVHFNLALYNLT